MVGTSIIVVVLVSLLLGSNCIKEDSFLKHQIKFCAYTCAAILSPISLMEWWGQYLRTSMDSIDVIAPLTLFAVTSVMAWMSRRAIIKKFRVDPAYI